MIRCLWNLIDRAARRHLAAHIRRADRSARIAETQGPYVESLRLRARERLDYNHLGQGLLLAFERKDDAP